MKKTHGFTLIELMITVTIIAILAAIAYPSYQEYMRKGRRVDAKVALLDAAQAMERSFTENMTYATATIGTVFSATSVNGDYTLSFDDQTANTFRVRATPTSTRQSGDGCGSYTLDHTGARNVVGGTMSVDQCW